MHRDFPMPLVAAKSIISNYIMPTRYDLHDGLIGSQVSGQPLSGLLLEETLCGPRAPWPTLCATTSL